MEKLLMSQTNSWSSLTLGDGMWAPIVSEQIEEEFLASFDEAGKPVGRDTHNGTYFRCCIGI
jgi:hypothetical protein